MNSRKARQVYNGPRVAKFVKVILKIDKSYGGQIHQKYIKGGFISMKTLWLSGKLSTSIENCNPCRLKVTLKIFEL